MAFMNYGYNPYAANMGYQMPQMPQYQQPVQQPQQPTTQPLSTDDRIWVPSQAAAEAYILPPGGFARLWNSNEPVYYEKYADAQGKPLPMNIVDYKSRNAQPAQEAAKQDDRYDNLSKRVDALEQAIKGVNGGAEQ